MEKQCLDNNCYNTVHQLTKTLEFLSHADTYIQDASNTGNKKSQEVWNTIKEDRQKHADMLKNLVISEVQSKKF
jgi:hypothetical protein